MRNNVGHDDRIGLFYYLYTMKIADEPFSKNLAVKIRAIHNEIYFTKLMCKVCEKNIVRSSSFLNMDQKGLLLLCSYIPFSPTPIKLLHLQERFCKKPIPN